ncbi:MAG: DegV family protein [Anaerolineae bacterium]|jgi:DegV family protein with EDD domain
MDSNTGPVAIMTDSTCDLPAELLEEYGITAVPLYILWGDEQLVDGRDIDADTFYARLPDDPHHPTTSQPTPADFVKALADVEEEDVVIITLSKALSGTYESAVKAAEEVDHRLHVMDSRSLSLGLGWQVLAAARAREKGAGVDGILAAAKRVRDTSILLLTLETLEYLHRGGRIGAVSKLLGSAIQLKPVLEIDHATGVLEPVAKIRTRKRAVRRVVEEAFERVDPCKPVRVAIIHGAAPDDAERLRREVEAICQPLEIIIGQITPVLGVHGGPGALGLLAFNE